MVEPTKEQVEQLKIIELEMLRHFISICEKLHLKYYLLGGTLLGAVRHNGFIPWDDDIDVGMPRKDYEIFIKNAQQYLPSYIFVQTIFSDSAFCLNYCKLRNSNTTFIESSVKNHNINHGIFIDVFPLDYYPSNKIKQRWFQLRKNLLGLRIATRFNIAPIKGVKKIKRFFGLLLTCFLSPPKALKKREKLYKTYNNGEYLANHGGAWGKKEIVPQDWYAEGVQLDFEGIKVNAPKQYDCWLNQVYGDYMKLPPVEKRVSHHYTEVIDLNKSYKEYFK